MVRLASFFLVGVFILAESALRRDAASRSIIATNDDAGTTRLIGLACAFAFNAGLLAPVLSRWKAARLKFEWSGPVGLVLMLVGLALRIWSAITLGRFYTRTLRVASDQQLVQSGPYALVRHPGYLASLIMWLGFGLCSGTWIAAASIPLAMGIAYGRRISVEEAMLRRTLGHAYEVYAGRTSRLVPGVF